MRDRLRSPKAWRSVGAARAPEARWGKLEVAARARSGTGQYSVGTVWTAPELKLIDGIRPWQARARSLCRALIEEPGKAWRTDDLMLECACGEPKMFKVLNELSRLGALELDWRGPSREARVRLTETGEDTVRSLLEAGRPKSVFGTLIWEGWTSAVAVWRYKRREKAWKRSRRR